MLLCQGDSGGPLTQDGILIGVVSGGDVTGFECDTSVSIQDCYRLLFIRLSKILKKIFSLLFWGQTIVAIEMKRSNICFGFAG